MTLLFVTGDSASLRRSRALRGHAAGMSRRRSESCAYAAVALSTKIAMLIFLRVKFALHYSICVIMRAELKVGGVGGDCRRAAAGARKLG